MPFKKVQGNVQEQVLPREAETHQAAPWPEPITLPKMKVVDYRGEFQQRYFYAVSPFIPHGVTAHDHVHSRHLVPQRCAADPGQHLGCPGHPLPEDPARNRSGAQAEHPSHGAGGVRELPPGGLRTIPGHHKRRGQSRWGRAQQIQGTPSPGSDPLVEEVP